MISAGTILANRYRVVGELGRGGMGVVLHAVDTLLERDVAVKVLATEEVNADLEARFRNEARIVARMDHPCIVPIFDFGRHERVLFFVMPLLQGNTLRELLAAGPLLPATATAVGIQISEALEYSHSRGVFHRDIKPENVMVLGEGPSLRVKVMDFGVAAAADAPDELGTIVGTVEYLSPEQARGEAPDRRTDLYCLGAVLYECLVGRPPFDGDRSQILFQVMHSRPEAIERVASGVPKGVAQLVQRCLAKRRSDRPDSAREVIDALFRVSSGASLQLPAARVSALPPAPGATGSTVTESTTRPLIGRGDELRRLQAHLALAHDERQLVLLGGPAGVGKSRLLEELESFATTRGVLVLRGRFYEQQEQTFAYHGFFEIVADFLQKGGRECQRLGDIAEPLAAIFPMVREELEVRRLLAPDAAAESHPAGKGEVFELLAQAFSRIGGGAPLVLILEGLHAATVSVDALQYLFRRLSATPTMMVASYRSEEVDGEHPVRQLASELRSEAAFAHLELRPLRRADHAQLLATLLGDERAGDELNERVFSVTEGNPLFLSELVRTLLDTGALARRDTGWRLEADRPELLASLPGSLQETVTVRLARLGAAEREVLACATVLDRSFSLDELAMVTQVEPLPRIVTKLVAEGYLCEEWDGTRAEHSERLVFPSAAHRAVLFRGLSTRRRRELNRHYAEQLEKAYASNPEVVQHRLARLYVLAGVADKALASAVLVARRSIDAAAPDDARWVLEQALAVGSRVPRDLIIAARQLLAEACAAEGDLDGAFEQLDRTLEAIGDSDPRRRLDVLGFGAEMAWQERRLQRVRRWTEEAIELAAQVARAATLRSFLQRAEAAARLEGDEEAACSFGRRLRDLGQGRSSVPPGLGPATTLPTSEQSPGELFLRSEYLAAREALDRARSNRERSQAGLSAEEEADYLHQLARLETKLGHYDDALERCIEAQNLVAQSDADHAATIDATMALALCAVGRFGDAEVATRRGFSRLKARLTSSDIRGRQREGALWRSQGTLYIGQGKVRQALDAFTRCLDLLEGTPDRWGHSIALYNTGDAYFYMGKYESALEYLDIAYMTKSALGDRWGLSYTQLLRAKIHLDRGRVEAGLESLASGLQLAQEINNLKLTAALRITEGRCELVRERVGVAEQSFQLALRDAAKWDARPEMIAALSALSDVRRVQGRLGPAYEAAKQALELVAETDALLLMPDALLALALAQAELELEAEAHLSLERALEAARAVGQPYRVLDVETALGRLDVSSGRYQTGIPRLQHVLEQAYTLEAVRPRALAAVALADFYGARGERGAASASAEVAEHCFELLGAERSLSGTRTLRVKFGADA